MALTQWVSDIPIQTLIHTSNILMSLKTHEFIIYLLEDGVGQGFSFQYFGWFAYSFSVKIKDLTSSAI